VLVELEVTSRDDHPHSTLTEDTLDAVLAGEDLSFADAITVGVNLHLQLYPSALKRREPRGVKSIVVECLSLDALLALRRVS
jgi:hypothetical protein